MQSTNVNTIVDLILEIIRKDVVKHGTKDNGGNLHESQFSRTS